MTLDLFRVVFVLAGALVGAAARSLGIAACLCFLSVCFLSVFSVFVCSLAP